jgi:hypothetical protein
MESWGRPDQDRVRPVVLWTIMQGVGKVWRFVVRGLVE